MLGGLSEQQLLEKLDDIEKYNDYEQNATFIGVIGIKDPVRPECKKSIEQCKTAGIRVMMITGDSKETATSIA